MGVYQVTRSPAFCCRTPVIRCQVRRRAEELFSTPLTPVTRAQQTSPPAPRTPSSNSTDFSVVLGTPATPITIDSDDGVIVLDADNNIILCENAAPQADSPTHCTMPAGITHIEVFYGEVLGPPADLDAVSLTLFSTPQTPTPEPSSIALFGTGLLAAAGLVRRRLFS